MKKKTNQNFDVDQVYDLIDDLSEQHSVGKRRDIRLLLLLDKSLSFFF